MKQPESVDDVNPSPRRRLVRVREAGAYGRIGETELYEYLHNGTVKAYKRRATTLVDLDSLDAFHASLPPFPTRGAQAKPEAKPPKGDKRKHGTKI